MQFEVFGTKMPAGSKPGAIITKPTQVGFLTVGIPFEGLIPYC